MKVMLKIKKERNGKTKKEKKKEKTEKLSLFVIIIYVKCLHWNNFSLYDGKKSSAKLGKKL